MTYLLWYLKGVDKMMREMQVPSKTSAGGSSRFSLAQAI